jgi:hypothetical protein
MTRRWKWCSIFNYSLSRRLNRGYAWVGKTDRGHLWCESFRKMCPFQWRNDLERSKFVLELKKDWLSRWDDSWSNMEKSIVHLPVALGPRSKCQFTSLTKHPLSFHFLCFFKRHCSEGCIIEWTWRATEVTWFELLNNNKRTQMRLSIELWELLMNWWTLSDKYCHGLRETFTAKAYKFELGTDGWDDLFVFQGSKLEADSKEQRWEDLNIMIYS